MLKPALSEVEATPKADCSVCPFRETLLPSARCLPGDVCVRAESGRQIDRFLKRNPHFAPDYLDDRFWERRAIAARAAERAPLAAARTLVEDPVAEVREIIAQRLKKAR